MQIDLRGKTALVTGSTQGLGYAIVKGLAQSGARVAVNGRSQDRVDGAVAKLREEIPGADLVPVTADVATEEGAARAVELLPEVDVLVNNVGIFDSVPPFEITDDEWRRYFEVNVLAAVRLTRLYLPGMTAKGWGRIQYIASDRAVVIPTEMIHYGVSKTALLGVSRGFAKAARGTGVTVNSVLVGRTSTSGAEDLVYQFVDRSVPWEQAQREFMKTYMPESLLGRFIEPEEVANLVTYLSSPLASATTGAAVRVDGGAVDAILP